MLRLECIVAFLGSAVVHHSCMFFVCRYRSKAWSYETFLLSSELLELVRCGNLSYFYLAYVLLQPVHELYEGYAIFDMAFSYVFKLNFIFYGLEHYSRVIFFYYLYF